MKSRSYIAVVLATAPIISYSTALTYPPGQPGHKGQPGTFEIIGNTLVSAQQVPSMPNSLD